MPKNLESQCFFGYIRVSTPKQGIEGVSLEAQKRAIEEYALRYGLPISQWFEERETAAKRGRPVFLQMLKLLRKGTARGVIMHKIDRSARNLKDWADLGELIDGGVEVHFATENYDLRSRGGRLSADIQAVVAADYIRNLREEVKKGVLGRLRQGRYPHPAPPGYLNKGKGFKEPDPVQGPLVREAFQLYATGRWSLERLVSEMYRRGLRNTVGGRVNLNMMWLLMKNPFYMGIIKVKSKKEVFPGIHKPVVSKALFDRVQAVLEGRLVDRQNQRDFIFQRLLSCGRCPYHLTGELQKGHTYYRCHTKACAQKCIREEKIHKALVGKFKSIWFPEETERYFLRRFEHFLQNAGTVKEKRIKAMQLRLDNVTQQLSRLANGYAAGILAPEVVREKQNALLAEKKGLEEDLKKKRGISMAVAKERMGSFFERAKNAAVTYKLSLPREQRGLVRTTTSNLTVQAENVDVELSFPFSDFEKSPKLLFSGPDREILRTWDTLLERLYQLCLEDPAFPLEPNSRDNFGSLRKAV